MRKSRSDLLAKESSSDMALLVEKVNTYKRDYNVKDVMYTSRMEKYCMMYYAFIEYSQKPGLSSDVRISKDDMSARLYNCLYRNCIDYYGDLRHIYRTGEIQRLRNLGNKCLDEAHNILFKKYNIDYKIGE